MSRPGDDAASRVTQAARLLSAGRAREAETLADSLSKQGVPANQRGRLLKVLGFARYTQGKLEPAAKVLEQAERLLAGDDSIPAARAQCHSQLGDNERALQVLTAARWRLPKSAQIAGSLADVLSRLGRTNEARQLIEESRAAGVWDRMLALAEVPLLNRVGEPETALRRLDELVQNDSSVQALAAVSFLRGECLDKLARHEDAFDAWALGNQRLGVSFNADAFRARIDRGVRTWAFDRVCELQAGSDRSLAPVFVVGMPRSGTTLVEQSLGRHPSLHPCGELLGGQHAEATLGRGEPTPEHLDTLARAYAGSLPSGLGSKRPVDKLPFNLLRAPMLAALYPEARFVLVRRDPRDTAVSLFARNFQSLHTYSTRLAWIAGVLGMVESATQHAVRTLGLDGTGQLVEVRYEELVDAPERELRRVLDAIGEPWDDACLTPGSGGGATLRVDQIGKGVFKSSAGRWKRYEAKLGTLIDHLRAHKLID